MLQKPWQAKGSQSKKPQQALSDGGFASRDPE
jgi:hypothetical protein